MTDILTQSASLALQGALKAFLKDALPDVRVFDDMPDGACMPYVFIGDDDEQDVGDADQPGSSHTISLVVASSANGYTQCKAIAGRLRDVLNGADLAVSGFEQTDLTWAGTSYRRHPDAATQRLARVQFSLELRPNL